MMFQRAPPEVNGLGVITSTPGLVRSSQVVMFFGLPLRTTNTTTESVTMPLYWSWSQLATRAWRPPGASMSGSREKGTKSAGWPAATARLWSPEAPYDWVKVTPLPAAVLLKAGISFA